MTRTEDTIRRKIACTQNFALFQTGGETDLDKKIDIRQYVSGVQDETLCFIIRKAMSDRC